MKRRFAILTAALALLVSLAIPMGVWGQTRDIKTDIMFAKGFAGYTNNSYSAVGTDRTAVANSTNATGVTYAMQVFNGSTGVVRGNQSGASNYSCRNTSTYDDYYISSVSLTVKTGTLDGGTNGRSVVYFGSSAYANPNTTTPSGTATASNENASGKTTLTWSNTDENVSYFILYNLKTSGNCYSDDATNSLKVVWTQKTQSSVAAPVLSLGTGTYAGTQSVEITCETTGANIYYTLDGTVPSASSTPYMGAVSITESKTLKAIAIKNNESSAVVTATYTILSPLTTMQQIFDNAGSSATTVAITFDDWVVSGINYYSPSTMAFVTDGNGKGCVIYNNSGHGFATGNSISGTVICSLQKMNGYARISGITASDVTVTTGGTVNVSNIALADLSGVNTGALVSYEDLECTVSGSNYYLTDGTTSLQVYKSLWNFTYSDYLTAGKSYNITGVYQQYTAGQSDTKEILPRSAADIEEIAETFINADNVTLAYDAISGSIVFTIDNPVEGQTLSASITGGNEGNWLTLGTIGETSIPLTCSANEGDADRSATITLSYTGADDKVITVTQAHYVPDYATLPFAYDGNGTGDLPNGFTVSGLGTYNSSPAMKFDGTGDYAILKFNERPGTLTFDIKGNSFSGGTFKVQTSADGVSYSDLETYDTFGSNETYEEEFDNLNENVRYIKWIYTQKVSGNVGLGNINLAKYVAPQEYTLEVTNISNAEIIVFDATNPDDTQWEYLFEGIDEVQVPEGTRIALSVSAVEGYVLETLVVNNVDHVADIEGGAYIFTMPANNVTISATAVEYVAPTGYAYVLYTGELVEGDYLIVYDGGAMNTTVTSDRLQYEDVTVNNDVITTDNAAIVWHIAPSGQYWTIYNADAEAYAASTGAKNKAQMLADGTDDKALWTVSVSGTETYEFVNKKNAANNVNANLRKNGEYGFACYATSTGGALSLYKKVALTIKGYGEVTNRGGYYLIASPLGTINPENVPGMLSDSYDLYRFDQVGDAQGNEWINYKGDATNPGMGNFDLEIGKGYLYAHSSDITLNFTGMPIEGTTYEVTLTKNVSARFKGWNLVGNPFAKTAYIDDTHNAYYTMDAAGALFVPVTGNSVDPMEGIFVVANSDRETITFSTTNPNEVKCSTLALNLSQGNGLMDRAIVRFDNGSQLPKLQFNRNSTKLYIPMDAEDYAVVRAEEMGEMPVNFKAESNGTYSLNFGMDNVEFAYLHLIDNLTGNDVDLLQTPSYSFEAKTTDYESRFKLVFATGDNSNEDNFAYFSNGSFVINNEGNATLQVIDITGRIVKCESINGCTNVNVNAAPGVYMLRLVNGDNVKVQKVVVR